MVDTGGTSPAERAPEAEPAEVLKQAEEVPDPDEETAVGAEKGLADPWLRSSIGPSTSLFR